MQLYISFILDTKQNHMNSYISRMETVDMVGVQNVTNKIRDT